MVVAPCRLLVLLRPNAACKLTVRAPRVAQERANVSVEKKNIAVSNLKALGTGTAEIRLHKSVTHKLKIVVAAE